MTDQHCLYVSGVIRCYVYCLSVVSDLPDVVMQCDLSIAELDCDLPTYVSIICGKCPLITLQTMLFRLWPN